MTESAVIVTTSPPTEGRALRRWALALNGLAVVLVFIGLVLPIVDTPTGAGGDCGTNVVATLWSDGADRAPEGFADDCRQNARTLARAAIGFVAGGFVVAGAGCLCWRTARARRPRGWAGAAVAAGGRAALPLGSRLTRARAELSAEEITLVMPAYTGQARWTMPLSEVTLVDPAGPGEAEPAGLGLAEPLLLPGFYDAPAFPWRRLTLLLRTPQRVPVLRRAHGTTSGLSAPETRSAAGAWADGVVLSFEDPDEAVAALARAGTASAPSVMAWAQTHRPLVPDPTGKRPRVRRPPAVRRLGARAVILVLYALVVLRWGAGGVVLVAFTAGVWLLAFLLLRTLYRPRAGG